MATRKKSPLNPVAAPTDTYVAPALPGPRLNQQSFGALTSLSQTLNQFLAAEQDRDIAYYEDAQRKAPERAAAIGQLEKQGKIGKSLSAVFDTDDPVDEENLKTLERLGVSGINSQYAVLMVRQARAVSRIQEADYEGFLNDPEWFVGFTSDVAADPSVYEQKLAERREAFMSSIGPLSQTAQTAALEEFDRTERSFRKHANDSIRKRRVEDLGQRFVTKLQPLQSALMASLEEPKNYESAKIVQKAKDDYGSEYRAQVRLLGEDVAKGNLMNALEGFLMSKMDTMSPSEIGHVLDNVRQAARIEDEDLELQKLEYTLIQRADSMREGKRSRRSEMRARLEHDLERLMYENQGSLMTRADREKFLFEGGGNDLLKNYDDDVVGSLRTEILNRPIVTSSDPDVLRGYQQDIVDGNTDGLFERMMASKMGGFIADDDFNVLVRDMGNRMSTGTSGTEYKQTRDGAFQAIKTGMGQLDGEGEMLMGEALIEYRNAYDRTFQETKDHTLALDAAKKRLFNDSTVWKRVQENQVANSWEGFEASRDYQDIANMLKTEQTEALQAAQARRDSGSDPDAFRKENRRWAKINARFRREAEQAWREIRQDPQIMGITNPTRRNALIAERLSEVADQMLDRAQGLNIQEPTKQDAFASSGRILQSVKRVSEDLDQVKIRDIIRIRESDYDWIDNTFAKVAGPLRDYAAEFQSGEKVYNPENDLVGGQAASGFESTSTLEYKGPRAELVAAAVLRGLRIDAQPEGNASPYIDLAARMTPQDAKDVLKTLILVRGLSPKEILSGEIAGYKVKLSDIYGDGSTDWRELIPWGRIPIATSTAEFDNLITDFETNKDESQLSKMLRAGGIDVGDKAGIDWFIQEQRRLMENADKNKSLLRLLRKAPKDHNADGKIPSWAKDLIKSRKESN